MSAKKPASTPATGLSENQFTALTFAVMAIAGLFMTFGYAPKVMVPRAICVWVLAVIAGEALAGRGQARTQERRDR